MIGTIQGPQSRGVIWEISLLPHTTLLCFPCSSYEGFLFVMKVAGWQNLKQALWKDKKRGKRQKVMY